MSPFQRLADVELTLILANLTATEAALAQRVSHQFRRASSSSDAKALIWGPRTREIPKVSDAMAAFALAPTLLPSPSVQYGTLLYAFYKDFEAQLKFLQNNKQKGFDYTQFDIEAEECSKAPKLHKIKDFLEKWNTALALFQIRKPNRNPQRISLTGLTQITPAIVNEIQAIGSQILKLSITNNRLDNLPKDIFKELNALQELDLKNNQLQTLHPQQFHGLDALQILNLTLNQLQTLHPQQFQELKALRFLHLVHNQLQTLHPQQFQGLKALRHLYLTQNKLQTLHPQQFQELNALQELGLGQNQLQALFPQQFQGLNALRVLYLSQNQLQTLHPQQFQGLNALGTLTLENNQLQTLHSQQFEGLNALHQVGLHNNHLIGLQPSYFIGTHAFIRLEPQTPVYNAVPPASLNREFGSLKRQGA